MRDVQPEFLVLKPLEEGERAAAADPGAVEERSAGGVGGAFLGAAEGEEAADRGALAHRHDRGAGLAAAGRDRRCAEQQREQGDPGRLADAFAHPDDVAAGDVAELVGDHALHLIGVVGRVISPEWR